MGEHDGAAGFTPGQRQGLGIALGKPRYVSRVDPISNTIVLGRREDLETTTFTIEDARFVNDAPPAPEFRAAIRIRHRAEPIPCVVSERGGAETGRGGRWLVETVIPVWAVAPGQAAVLYDGDVCLGGGRIARPAGQGSTGLGSADGDRVSGARSLPGGTIRPVRQAPVAGAMT